MIDEIKKLDGYADMTAAEIAAALNAIPLHHRDAAITGGPSNTASVNLLHLLTARFKVMRQNKSQEWVGPLVDVGESNADVGFALGMLYPHLQVKDSVAFCSASTEAAQMVNGIVATIGGILEASETGTTQDVADAVAVLTGGRKFGNVTADQVTAALAKAAIEPIWQAKQAVVADGIHDGTITTLAEIVSAIEGA